MKTDIKKWTYGCEFELADWDTSKGWLEKEEGFKRDPEPNIGNTNGIATDPLLKSYKFGGEVNTRPTKTPEGQVTLLKKFLHYHKNAVPTYRSGLHVHIHIPGLRDNLQKLKTLQEFIQTNSAIYQKIDVMPEVPRSKKAERKRWNWMKRSHWTTIPSYRVEKQLGCRSVEEFFRLEVPKSKKGEPLWHAQPRAAVNLRQLLQTDTIEFRHYTMSINFDEVLTAIEWCRDYLRVAFGLFSGKYNSADELFEAEYRERRFPTLADYPFDERKEKIWEMTTITKNPRYVIEKNIVGVLSGEIIF